MENKEPMTDNQRGLLRRLVAEDGTYDWDGDDIGSVSKEEASELIDELKERLGED